MSTEHHRIRELLVLVGLAVCALAPLAQAREVYIPPALEQWRGWVLDQHRDLNCPFVYSNAGVRPCVWTTSVDIAADANGARFSIELETFVETNVTLPGDAKSWPQGVTSDGHDLVVTRANDRPRAMLKPGRHAIAGRFVWKRLPDSLMLPPNHGLLALTVDGRSVAQPLLEGDTLWLTRTTQPVAANDTLEVHVYRRIVDGVPLSMTTIVALSVGGSHRTVALGRALLDGFEVTKLKGDLPARIERDGTLRVQVEPGSWSVGFDARALAVVDALRMQKATADWPEQEIWGFEAARGLRVVNVEGVPSIDLSQTDAPFSDIPGFLVRPNDEFKLVQQFRGDPNPSPNDYQLARQLYLAFDGGSYVLSDDLHAKVERPTRLAARFVPGRVTVDDEPMLITSLDGEAPGVELEQGEHDVKAVSEVPRAALDDALGWNLDATSVRATLHLPPAWRLLWTRGVDRAPDAWLAKWTVWSLFLVLVSTVAAARVLGAAAAVATGVGLVLVYHEAQAPIYVWPVLLALLAALSATRAGTLKNVVRALFALIWLGAALGVLAFTIDHFRMAIYPQLEEPDVVAAMLQAPGAPAAAPAMRSDSLGRVAKMEALSESKPKQVETIVVTGQKISNEPTPDLKVQTGPAEPRWTWHQVELAWDGPVKAGQPMHLALSPPVLTRALYVVGPLVLIALVVLYGIGALGGGSTGLGSWRDLVRRSAPAATALLLAVLPALHARAESARAESARSDALPDEQLLKELERRLTAPPECAPGCASFEQIKVVVDARKLAMTIVASSAEATAVPLPVATHQWSPTDVKVDGKPATLRRDDGRTLEVVLVPGRHEIELTADVSRLDRFEVPLSLPPGNLALDLAGWQAFGAEEGRALGRSIQLARIAPSHDESDASTSLKALPIAPFYRVEREIAFGLKWQMGTTIRRIAPAEGSLPFNVPLLPGESVLSGDITVKDGRASGVLAPGENEVEYASTLAPAADLRLTAPALATAAEMWTLVPSNRWHVDATGVPESKVDPNETNGPRYQPLPGESLDVHVTQPTALPGDTVTVESVRLRESPGGRVRRSTIELDLLASQGGDYAVHLPAGATILEVSVDGKPEPIPAANDSTVALPITPGRDRASITFETAAPFATMLETSEIGLASAPRNIALEIDGTGDRWLLAVGGPALGPALLYWGVMALVVVLAVLLARVPGMPLTRIDAVLLGFGMTLCNLPSTVLVAAWLLLLLARRRFASRMLEIEPFNRQLVQVALAIVSIVAVIALAASVPLGLLGSPDVQITGNGSSASALQWFQDRATDRLPTAWVVSAPMVAYRIVMLAWSLWLALALIRWIRWSWESYSTGGAWWKVGPVANPPLT